MASGALVPRLRVVTRETGHLDDLLALTTAYDPLYWSRRGETLSAFGTVHVIGGPGTAPLSSDEIADVWRRIAESARIDDPVGIPGTGLVGFGSFVFDPDSAARSILTVPDTIVGHRDGRTWVTRISLADATDDGEPTLPPRSPYGPHWSATLGPGAQTAEGYQDAVRGALDLIAAGDAQKIVLARDVVGDLPRGSDLRRLVRALASAYPDCWTFAVDGLIGASPETLVTVSAGTVTARVLAGTAARGADEDADTAAATDLATSPKNIEEHRFAVQSVMSSLRPHTSALAHDDAFTLKLPNVWHLATDVEGVLADGGSALQMIGALHPTAAVAGTPTDAALAAIRELEPFDRGRYAGAVGWVDAAGDGEWAIALRCAQFVPVDGDGIALTAYAGAGIVAGSDPEAELLETRVKFRPIVEALA